MISKTSVTEEGGYPREDKCRYCGDHIGWVIAPGFEWIALGVCDKKECKLKQRADEEARIEGEEEH